MTAPVRVSGPTFAPFPPSSQPFSVRPGFHCIMAFGHLCCADDLSSFLFRPQEGVADRPLLSLSMIATESPQWEGLLPLGSPSSNYTILIAGRCDTQTSYKNGANMPSLYEFLMRLRYKIYSSE